MQVSITGPFRYEELDQLGRDDTLKECPNVSPAEGAVLSVVGVPHRELLWLLATTPHGSILGVAGLQTRHRCVVAAKFWGQTGVPSLLIYSARAYLKMLGSAPVEIILGADNREFLAAALAAGFEVVELNELRHELTLRSY